MVVIYIIVFLMLWYLNILALITLLGAEKGAIVGTLMILIAFIISVVDLYIPILVLAAMMIVAIGKIKKII